MKYLIWLGALSLWAQTEVHVQGVSDYVWRGFSQSDEGPALQGGLDWQYKGFGLGAWGSSVKGLGDSGQDSDVEVDLTASFAFGLNDHLDLKAGLIGYRYLEHSGANLDEWHLGLESTSVQLVLYRDFDANYFYYTLSGAYALAEKWDLSGTVGMLDVDAGGSFADALVTVTRRWPALEGWLAVSWSESDLELAKTRIILGLKKAWTF
jgi:uncharacterized protein (TIGR02001 family)